jgi:hypothetical protein
MMTIGLSGRNLQPIIITHDETEVRVDVGAGAATEWPLGSAAGHFRCDFQMKIQVITAANTMKSDGGKLWVLSPAKRKGETEAINPKTRKSRKIAEMRLTSEELIEMRS